MGGWSVSGASSDRRRKRRRVAPSAAPPGEVTAKPRPGAPTPPGSQEPAPDWYGDTTVSVLGCQRIPDGDDAFRCYFKNICGRNPLGQHWLTELLTTMADEDTDVVILVDVKGDDQSPLTNFTAGVLKLAVAKFTVAGLKEAPFVAEVRVLRLSVRSWAR